MKRRGQAIGSLTNAHVMLGRADFFSICLQVLLLLESVLLEQIRYILPSSTCSQLLVIGISRYIVSNDLPNLSKPEIRCSILMSAELHSRVNLRIALVFWPGAIHFPF